MYKLVSRIMTTAAIALVLSGCNSLSYYGQAISGHMDLVSRERPIDDMLKDNDTPDALKNKLKLALDARAFASEQIGLPNNDSYKSYADLGRPYAVWNVIATPHYSIETKQWCFLLVGCLSYRGYFAQQEAQALAEQLRTQGMDVIVSGAAAYSTLGWMDDPLLNTVVVRSDASMVGIIFHELAHQVVYVDGDSAFNEAFATAVEYEGLRRWYVMQKNEQAYVQYRDKKAQQQMIYEQLETTRTQLNAIYQQDIPDAQKQRLKQQAFAELKSWYRDWRKTHSYGGFDDWMDKDLNNAHLALIATYQEMVPEFLSALQSVDGNMNEFYELVKAMAPLDKNERRKQLAAYRFQLQAKK
jgi:predicted aminopeptidase